MRAIHFVVPSGSDLEGKKLTLIAQYLRAPCKKVVLNLQQTLMGCPE